MTLFHVTAVEHLSLAKHLTAETRTEEFVAGKGGVTRWERLKRNNHWFDALYNACCAAHACGVRLVGEQVLQSTPASGVDAPSIAPSEWLQRRNRW